MILDFISNIKKHSLLHPHFRTVTEFIENNTLASFTPGKYPIQGDDIFVIVDHGLGKGRENARLEAHRVYIDIQYCLTGEDTIGIAPLSTCKETLEAYDQSRDIIFFKDSIKEWITITTEKCAIFFPCDAHAPLAGHGPIQKVVFKVKV
jgi:YhcH/YjgK/YiaL family protein